MSNFEPPYSYTAEEERAYRSALSIGNGISDELKLPFLAILGYSDMLMESVEPGPDQDCVRQIRINTTRLLESFLSYRELKRIEAGKFCVLQSFGSPLEIAYEALDLLFSGYPQYRLTPVFHHDDTVPRLIHVDEFALREILRSLIFFALERCRDDGRLRLLVHSDDYAEKSGRVRVDFIVDTDSFDLMPMEVARLQLPFDQAPGQASREFGGAEQSLLLCRRLVHLLSGSFSLTSQIGSGTRFELRIPAKIIRENAN